MNPSAVTYHLKTLGRLELTRSDGTSVDSILSQPKRLALLAYLAVANGGALCRRDTVLGIFWPEFDQERARAALRKALHFLRRELGTDVVVGRGDEEVGVDASRLACDVHGFESALTQRDLARALLTYTGDFLDGFYISDAPEFEQWASETRCDLTARGAQSAAELTGHALQSNDVKRAIHAAQQWVRLAPQDEAAARAAMSALDKAGERGEALDEYAALVARLQRLEVEPSAETRALESHIRVHPDRARHVKVDRWLGASPQSRSRSILTVSLGLALITGITLLSIASLGRAASPDPETVEVRRLSNMTDDSSLSHIGAVYQRAILDGIAAMRRLRVVPHGENSEPAAFTVDGSYHRRGDSLEFIISIQDHLRNRLLPAPEPVRAPLHDATTALERVRDRTVGALGYYTSFWAPSFPSRRPPDYDVYVAFQEALQTVLRWGDFNEPRRARADSLLRFVIERDPGYTEAYFLLGGFIIPVMTGPATRQGQPGQYGRYDLIDSLVREIQDGTRSVAEDDQLAVDYLTAVAQGNYARALDALLHATPLYPELTFRVAAEAVKANAPSRAVETIRRLTPETAWVS